MSLVRLSLECGGYLISLIGNKAAIERPPRKLITKDRDKKDKDKILKQIALKYKIDEEINEDFETSSDLYAHTEEDYNLLDEDNILKSKNKYFGKPAKDKFWELYKSDRTFKDNMEKEVKDPRFAYIKTCHEMKVLPKAGLIIKSEESSRLSFANQGLLSKNSKAIWECLKRYSLEVEAVDFTGNGLKATDWILLSESLDRHWATLLELNFSNNKIGYDGALSMWEKLRKMKLLETLNLNGNLLGDDAMTEITKVLNGLLNIKSLSFSNNALGNKVSDSQFIEQFTILLKNTGSLTDVDLSWNNFRGEGAAQLLLGFKENFTVKDLDLSYNLFGVKGANKEPAIFKFTEVLQENSTLENVNLANNLLDVNAAFNLAEGLRTNTSLKTFVMNGNPIESSGIKYLFQSMNSNKNGKVENIKLEETETIVESKNIVFDPTNVEKEYTLDLSSINDRVILFHLLDIDEKLAHNWPEEDNFQQGDWFIDARLAGSSWSLPREKEKDGRWNIGEDPKDKLVFKFSLDPKNIDKGGKGEEMYVGTVVDSKNVIKPLIPDEVLDKNIDFLCRLGIEENYSWIRELIDTIWQEYLITYSQAKELIDCIDENHRNHAWISLFNRIINRHFRFDILQSLNNLETKQSVMDYLGESYNFNYHNPTGHYRLRLNNKSEREVALTLLMFNRKYSSLIGQGILTDKSKMGNQSWFRNEKLIHKNSLSYGSSLLSPEVDPETGEFKESGIPFIYNENFILPDYGILECDFIYLVNPPIKSDETSEEKQDLIKNTLLEVEGKVDLQISIFKSFSEYLALSSEQLSSFIELIDDPKWKTECYLSGIGRVYDTHNYDFIK